VPSAHASPSRRRARAGIVASTWPVFGSIFWDAVPLRSEKRCLPSNAVPACAATSIERALFSRSAGSKALSLSPAANQTFLRHTSRPPTLSTPGKGPYSRTIVAADLFMVHPSLIDVRSRSTTLS